MAEGIALNLDNLPRSLFLSHKDGQVALTFLDQTLLPKEVKMVETTAWMCVVDAIKTLQVRGAPAIGIAGASAMALWANHARDFEELETVAQTVANARPTAVNLAWAVNRAVSCAKECKAAGGELAEVADALFALAVEMEAEDEAVNRAIGAHGAKLLKPGSRILTHCNAGSLATAFYGTALGVVYAAAEQGKVERVYADETRPVGQGARLTVWELSRAGVPTTLICDNMAASLMASGQIDAVIVGADRIAANGDAANKIGTYGVAILAKHHGIPFYVAAPYSTLDLSLPDGSQIPIEQRAVNEVLPNPIDGVEVWNPAFDVTPGELIAGVITERGVFCPGSAFKEQILKAQDDKQ